MTKVSSYDGEAAIQLAELADEHIIYEPYPFNLLDKDILTIDFSRMIEEIALDVLAGKNIANISGRFHETVVQAIVAAMEQLYRRSVQAETLFYQAAACITVIYEKESVRN